jgi:hypothetical protein
MMKLTGLYAKLSVEQVSGYGALGPRRSRTSNWTREPLRRAWEATGFGLRDYHDRRVRQPEILCLVIVLIGVLCQ